MMNPMQPDIGKPNPMAEASSGPFTAAPVMPGVVGPMPVGVIGRAVPDSPAPMMAPRAGVAGVGGMANVAQQIQGQQERQAISDRMSQMTGVRGEGAATGWSAPDYATPAGNNFYGR